MLFCVKIAMVLIGIDCRLFVLIVGLVVGIGDVADKLKLGYRGLQSLMDWTSISMGVRGAGNFNERKVKAEGETVG